MNRQGINKKVREKYTPEGSRILVLADVVEEKTAGGIILAQQSRESEQMRVTKGTILGIGPTVDLLFTENGKQRKAHYGDRIIFAKYGGMKVHDEEFKDVDIRLIYDADVVALVKDGKENNE